MQPIVNRQNIACFVNFLCRYLWNKLILLNIVIQISIFKKFCFFQQQQLHLLQPAQVQRRVSIFLHTDIYISQISWSI